MSRSPKSVLVYGTLLAAALPLSTADAGTDQGELRRFIDEMTAEHGFDQTWLEKILAQAEHKPAIVDAISRPAEKVKPWHEYRQLFVNDRRIDAGVRFWAEHHEALDAAADRFGVPPQLIVAVLGVETYYGNITGGYRVLDALTTLAFGYPPRSAFFRSELEQFLLLTREETLDPLTATGSYAGAMGVPQFISSSYRRYSVDSNGDGKRDLWSDWSDVVGSVANYFREHGWRPGESVAVPARLERVAAAGLAGNGLKLSHEVGELRARGIEFDSGQPDAAPAALMIMEGTGGPEYWVGFRNFHVITRYNHSSMYALAVHQLGEAIAARVAHEAS